MLSQLSIFCLTYNRPKFVKRLIKYWQENFKESKIFILDGSEIEINKSNLNLTETNNIKYIHCKNKTYFERYFFMSSSQRKFRFDYIRLHYIVLY